MGSCVVSNPEGPHDPIDPMLGHIEELLSTMGSEHLGAVAASGTADTSGLEVPRPLLPSTPNDVKWEAWHGGEVSVVDCSDDRHRGGVIKIYRSPQVEAGYVLHPPVGPDIQISLDDIIQIFPRDADGNPPEHPTFIFQGIDDVPPGYTLTYDGAKVKSTEEEMKERMQEPPPEVYIAGNLEDPEHILGERLEADNRRLRFLSNLFGTGSGVIRPDIELDRQTTLVWYPLSGKSLNVVTPSGRLIKGHRNDIVELVRTYPDGSVSTLRRATLSKLAQDEDKYMVIDESYNGR